MKTREYLALTAEGRAKRLLNGSGGLDTTGATLKERQEARALQMAAFDHILLNEASEYREIFVELVVLSDEAKMLTKEFMGNTERKTAIALLCFRYADVYGKLVKLGLDNTDHKRHHFNG